MFDSLHVKSPAYGNAFTSMHLLRWLPNVHTSCLPMLGLRPLPKTTYSASKWPLLIVAWVTKAWCYLPWKFTKDKESNCVTFCENFTEDKEYLHAIFCMTLTFNPLQAMVVTYLYAKVWRQWSVCSKDRVETFLLYDVIFSVTSVRMGW